MAPTGGRRAAAIAAAAALSKPIRPVAGKKRLKPTVQSTKPRQSNRICDQNIYMNLDDDDESSGNEIEIDAKKQRIITPKPPPPITIQSHSIVQLKKSLESIKNISVKDINYKITQTGVKIFTSNTTAFNIVKKHCEENNMQGYTHTAADERFVKVCLYGLWSMDTGIIMNELKTVGLEPVEIKQLTISKPRYTEQAIYLLYFQRKQHITLDQLKAVRGLFNVIIDWRYYKNRSKQPTQCEVCLQFGHGKSNCFGKSAVCFRCAGPHSGSHCPFLVPANKENEKPRIDDNLVKCALCKTKGHTATDRNCESRRKYNELQHSLKTRFQSQSQASTQHGVKINSRREFPASLHAPPSHPPSTSSRAFIPAPPPTHSAWSNSLETETIKKGLTNQPQINDRPYYYQPHRSEDLLTTSECMELFDYFITELLKCRNKIEQIKTIARLSLEQISKYLTPSFNNDSR